MDTDAPTSSPPHPKQSRLSVGLTVGSAVAVALGGLLHLRVWDSDYREIPNGAVPGLWVVKTGFPANAVASVLVAAALVVLAFGVLGRARLAVIGAALALQVGSIVALVASRGPGIFGWTETGYEGDALQILAVEVVAVVLLVGTIVADRVLAGKKS